MVANGRYAQEDIGGNPFTSEENTSPFKTEEVDNTEEDGSDSSKDSSKENDNNNENNGNGKNRPRRGPFARMRRGLDNARPRRSKSGGAENNEEQAISTENKIETVASADTKIAPAVSPINKPNPKARSAAANGAFREGVVLTQIGADVGMAAAEAYAEAHGWDVTVCICDPNGIPIQVKRNTSIGAASYDMAVEKAKSAAMFGKPTGVGATASKSSTKEATAALVSVYPFMHMAGGVPLILNGKCCGAVGVSSGIIMTENDERIALASVKSMADMYWSYQVMAEEEARGKPPPGPP